MDGGAFQYRKIIISGRREYMAGIGVKLTNIYKKNTLRYHRSWIQYGRYHCANACCDRCTCTYGILSGFFLCSLYYKGTVFLYSAVYFYFLIADSITV